MNILFAASEAAPFIKTGGLGDVAGSLPPVLAAAGNDVRVVLPLYYGVEQKWRDQMTFLKETRIRLSWRNNYCGVFELRRDGVVYYFIDNEYYFKREELYGHFDDGERFAFFSRAVLKLPFLVDFAPDVIHCNDWQTALVPVYLRRERDTFPQLKNTRTVYTIHNIEYQGRYAPTVLGDVFGLPDEDYREDLLRYYDDVNLTKGAIYSADAVTAVSPTYARELEDDFYAHGLAGVVRANRGKITGILNGIDMDLNSPAVAGTLAETYSAEKPEGKKACKKALQQAVGLNDAPAAPIVACVSRLVEHKGFDLVLPVLDDIMALGVQMVVLGTGDWKYEEAFRNAARRYPGRFSAQVLYSQTLSQVIYAGADLFLMPSVCEPCGLSQMIAMRYGTVPLVRETGGLKDTVIPYNKYTGEGRGFTFTNASAQDMLYVLRQAVELFRTDRAAWRGLQQAGMTADFSWTASAKEYLKLYRRLTGTAKPGHGGKHAV